VSVAERAGALLAEVARYRAESCAAILAAAREEVAGYVAHAHAEALHRFHAGAAETRKRAAERLRAAEAAVAAVARQRAQEVEWAVVARGRATLAASLAARWATVATRSRWLAWAAESAAARLEGGEWTLAHPVGWATAEWAAAVAELPVSVATPRFVADLQMVGGVRITAAGATVDATVAGLLGHGDWIGGRLLALTLAGGEGKR